MNSSEGQMEIKVWHSVLMEQHSVSPSVFWLKNTGENRDEKEDTQIKVWQWPHLAVHEQLRVP
jgi:hypothetical protein